MEEECEEIGLKFCCTTHYRILCRSFKFTKWNSVFLWKIITSYEFAINIESFIKLFAINQFRNIIY